MIYSTVLYVISQHNNTYNAAMNNSKPTFDSIPEAIENLQADISEIKRLLNQEQQDPKPGTQLMILQEVADFLHLSTSSIYRLVSGRSIPFHKVGGRLYFMENELIDWIKAGRKSFLE